MELKTGVSAKPVLIFLVLILGAILLFWFMVYQPVSAERRLQEAVALVESGNYEEAVPVLQKLISASFDSPRKRKARLLLARCHTHLGKYRKASGLWEEIVSDPDSSRREEAEFYLGWIAREQGDSKTAQRRLADHARRFPRSPWGGKVQLALARVKQSSGDLLGARDAYRRVLEDFPDNTLVQQAQKELGELNLAILFSLLIGEGSQEYIVQAGDSLSSIAGRFNTTPALLQKANQIEGNLIRLGQKLKVPKHRFEVVISKSQNTLMLLYGGRFSKIYSVGTGQHNSTPTGRFQIVTKLIDPPWYHAGEKIPPGDTRNILGARWLGFAEPDAEYGIHGTTQPETIGSQSSEGCIRMLNCDVIQIFDLLPRGTWVTVIE